MTDATHNLSSPRNTGTRTYRLPIWSDANWIVRIALLIGLILIVTALAAPWVAPFDPNAQSLISRLRPPIGFERYKDGFYFGTDELGRDIFSRCIYGLHQTLGRG